MAGWLPMLLSMLTAVAFRVDHESLAESPGLIVEGLAVNETIAGPGGVVDVREMLKSSDSPSPSSIWLLMVVPLIVAVKGLTFPFFSTSTNAPLRLFPLICPVMKTFPGGASVTVQPRLLA